MLVSGVKMYVPHITICYQFFICVDLSCYRVFFQPQRLPLKFLCITVLTMFIWSVLIFPSFWKDSFVEYRFPRS